MGCHYRFQSNSALSLSHKDHPGKGLHNTSPSPDLHHQEDQPTNPGPNHHHQSPNHLTSHLHQNHTAHHPSPLTGLHPLRSRNTSLSHNINPHHHNTSPNLSLRGHHHSLQNTNLVHLHHQRSQVTNPNPLLHLKLNIKANQ